MLLQGLGDRATGHAMVQVFQSPLDSRIAPAWVVLGHLDNQATDLLHDAGAPDALPRKGPLCGDQTTMPGQDRVGSHDACDPSKYSPAEWFPFGSQSATLVVGQAHSTAAGLDLFF